MIPAGVLSAIAACAMTFTAHAQTANLTPQQQYDAAFSLLKGQKYDEAQTAFAQFVAKNPNDALAGVAQYWLGETLYARGSFADAATAFVKGYQTYPTSTKAADTLLKAGMSLEQLGKSKEACTALGRLKVDFPNAASSLMRQASAVSQRLKCAN